MLSNYPIFEGKRAVGNPRPDACELAGLGFRLLDCREPITTGSGITLRTVAIAFVATTGKKKFARSPAPISTAGNVQYAPSFVGS